MDLLSGWYPGLGEVEMIRRMSPAVQEFVADAAHEYDGFVGEYLLGILDEYECPNDKILHDLSLAVYRVNCQDLGLAGYDDDGSGLGELGGVFKKIRKAVQKVAKKVIAPIKKVAEKITPKPLLNLQKKVAKAVTSVNKKVMQVHDKIEHVAGQVGKKYGNVIIQAAGMVLAPFTGGLSMVAAQALTAANTAYQKKRMADQAKKAARKDAGQLTAEADQAKNLAEQQMNDFYNQNREYFIKQGMTPEKWAAMSFDQKVAYLQSGMGSGGGSTPPGDSSPPPVGINQPPSSGGGGGGGTPGGGGGGGGGGSGMEYPSGDGGAPAGGPKIATSSMFSGPMLPMLAAGVALALVFGKPVPGRKTKRNPGRRRRRVA